ncbi:uncharacterized protein L3040_001763 [Drepanopeziza brunnea f. sp. 'multigermtubi']|uniref:Dihydroxyacetone kinase n=1 Tax=Marssonina brunnea f. sp. multigermtubi (strain MB_m1) TaxID=1072389 RepID=K1WQU5_MARBU|nr:dihydroxyacetone kinase [Drepanopeziza brunnea f. sp. 'multigermtubi' MB_m1]EKD15396.1 dihydroxyacetone kinase [Drepanopeziza brunnea f. sp. 'multigermtubi' MB_m1]KAJ5052003.1 hypothetical protein L3040_001763 [Drepanopeziza brunnea f. sp. 'multigermtubi']
MSIVVEQTLPYSSAQLQLEDPTRWSRLLPLIRPSVKSIETANGQTVLVDTALASSENVLVAVVGRVGNFSSKILSESHLVAAFTVEQREKGISARDLARALEESGFPTENGVVVLRAGGAQDLTMAAGVIELTLDGVLKLDHILSLFAAAKPNVKASFEKTRALLDHFVGSTADTTSTFHKQKSGDRPAVAHAAGLVAFNSAKSSIDKDLSSLLRSKTPSTDSIFSIHYSDVNGLSRLENNILAHEISGFLAGRDSASYISQSTILNSQSQARGWAISSCVLPAYLLTPQAKPTNPLASANDSAPSEPSDITSAITFSDAQVRRMVTAGCERVIKEESTITEYDTIVGDGDCGYTLRDGATQVMSYVRTADLSKLPSTLRDLVDDLEVTMGGTSGALYCIFLSSLAQHLRHASTFPAALAGALESLLRYTRARLGDRTCLDCLIPFVETLKATGDSKKALSEAGNGVEGTKMLEARLGRSSYLDESATRGVPDPGAYGLLVLLEGMVGAQ